MKRKNAINPAEENQKFLKFYNSRWQAMKSARQPFDKKFNNIDVSLLKKSTIDSFWNYMVSLKEERNVMEMSAGREWTNLNYTLRPTGIPDNDEIIVAKMLLDYGIYAWDFHYEWERWLAERRRYGTCFFFTGIWEKIKKTYEPDEEEDINGIYDMGYKEHLEVQNVFTPKFVPVRNVWVDDRAIYSGMRYATDCIIQETATYEEIVKRWGQNPKFHNINLLNKKKVENQDQAYPVVIDWFSGNTENKPIVIHHYYNKDTGDVAIIGNYEVLLYRGKMVFGNGNLPIAVAQYFKDETCIYGMGIPEKIQPMAIYKEEIVQNLLDNSRMSGSPLLFMANRGDVDGTQNISTNKINKISFTGGISDVQMSQVQSNVGNYQAVINFIDSQITMDSGENLRSTYEPAAAQLWTVEIIENNRNTRLWTLEDGKNRLLSDCLNAAMDNIIQFGYKLMSKTENIDGKKKTTNPIIVVPDKKITQSGNKIEQVEDLGEFGYFEFRKDMVKQRYRVVVQTVSNNAVWKIVEKNNLTQYINNKVALWQLNPQLATPEEINNIWKLMDMYWDYNFNTFPDSKKDKKLKKAEEMKSKILGMVGLWEWQDPIAQMMWGQWGGMQQLTPAEPIPNQPVI